MGFSQRDLLSAIRLAKTENWSASPETGTVTLTGSNLRAVFNTNPSDSVPWVRAETAHGELSLPKSHCMAQQIQRRIERRLTADGLALGQRAPKCVEELLQPTQGAQPRVWVPGEPQERRRFFPGCVSVWWRQAFTTQLSDGFRATVTHKEFFGPGLSPPILEIELAIEHDRLNELRKAFGMSPAVLYLDEKEVWDHDTRSKAAMLCAILNAAKTSANANR